MDIYAERCICGRTFSQPYALTNHQRTCQKTKKRLSSALSKAQDLWVNRKKIRLNRPDAEVSQELLRQPVAHQEPRQEVCHGFSFDHIAHIYPQQADTDPSDVCADAHLSMMERRPWTRRIRRRLLKRYRDMLPEPHPPAVQTSPSHLAPSTSDQSSHGASIPSLISSVGRRIQHFFTTKPNKFGLFRRYHRKDPPSHDPEQNVSFRDLCEADDAAGSAPPDSPPDVYHPYPNRSSFRLGEWYWNGGIQKSQASFKDLVNIVGDPAFSPTDVQNVNWDRINHALANDDEWVDQDAGWEKTEVSILVPFQPRRGAISDADAGPKQYVVGDFYHRSLVSVIKEKLSSAIDNDHFHYEPYELQWQRNKHSQPIRVHGELYTSQAFLDAHNALQNSPPEPGCTLPRHVIALMFSSDSTHLTSFGDASLWPIYLYFGNESKYRRCNPTCHLGNHVGYIKKVKHSPFSHFRVLIILFRSYLTHSGNLQRVKQVPIKRRVRPS
jgi:hypothetical protein